MGWRCMKAEDMPWVLHIPLCREGMMLHVWPTDSDVDTHAEEEEKMKLGTQSWYSLHSVTTSCSGRMCVMEDALVPRGT